MRRRAFDHIQKLSFGFFDNQKTGHLVGRVTKDLEEVGEVAHHGPEDAFIAIMTLVGAFALMFYIEPKLALITALIVRSPVSSPPAMVAGWLALGAASSVASVSSTPGSKKTLAASGWCRPSPMKITNAPCLPATT
jgi:ABC-type multidrug transport system fused ATPase/permease subunit